MANSVAPNLSRSGWPFGLLSLEVLAPLEAMEDFAFALVWVEFGCRDVISKE